MLSNEQEKIISEKLIELYLPYKGKRMAYFFENRSIAIRAVDNKDYVTSSLELHLVGADYSYTIGEITDYKDHVVIELRLHMLNYIQDLLILHLCN